MQACCQLACCFGAPGAPDREGGCSMIRLAILGRDGQRHAVPLFALRYSLDGGITWQLAGPLTGRDAQRRKRGIVAAGGRAEVYSWGPPPGPDKAAQK